MNRRPLLLVLVLFAGLLLAPIDAARSQAGGADVLVARLRDMVRQADLGDRLGVHVVDAESGREIFRHRSELPLNPASNMKLVTAAGVMLKLGPDFRMLTGLYGRIDAGRVEELVLKGYGDPTLRMSDLVELAEGLADRGVRAVGRVRVDGSYFDDEILPPAFEQQPEEMSAFRAAVGAVAVERASYVLRVMPGSEVGGAARVRLAAEGYFEVDNRITTSEGGAPNVIVVQRSRDDGRLLLRLRGTVPTGILGVSYRRRVDNPLVHAGHAMREALSRAGIRVGEAVRVGRMDHGLPLLTSRRSAPVSQVLSALGKNSDNFVAEMMLKVLGAEHQRPGSSAGGAEVLQQVLAEAGIQRGQASFVNGSGLFDGNRIAASHLTALLSHVYSNSGIRPEYLSHLAVGGVDGTLRRRMQNLPAPRIVRAKTGTLNDVIALSGYVLGPEGRRAYAFSFLANGARGRHGAARNLADAIVSALAADLHP